MSGGLAGGGGVKKGPPIAARDTTIQTPSAAHRTTI